MKSIHDKPSIWDLEVFFLSVGGIGFIKFAPGTFGSLATMPILFILFHFQIPYFFLAPFALLLSVGSILVAERVQKKYHLHDPGWIVVDEVCGMLVASLFIPSFDLFYLFFLFALFRFFDIVKIWPASYFDKRVKHGAGTILDDVISGIYTGLVLQIFHKLVF